MQRILRINLQSRNRALRRTKKETYDTMRKDWKDFAERERVQNRVRLASVREERLSRREDWVRGPLASNRNSGANAGFYGTVDQALSAGPVYPPGELKGPKGNGWDPLGTEPRRRKGDPEHKEWEGTGNEGNIVQGDRVCVVNGRPGVKGQIGVVKSVANDSKEVTVEGINMADIAIPPHFPEQRQRYKLQAQAMPLNIHDVRLVHRYTDPQTHIDRDVIVKIVRGGAPHLTRPMNSPIPRHTRYIAGEDIEIPWPADDHIEPMEVYECDTTREPVEKETWRPTPYDPPIPEHAGGKHSIFDELFAEQKYARDRRVHEKDYVTGRVLQDARAEWYRTRKVLSPMERMVEEEKMRSAERREQQRQSGMSEGTRRIIEAQMVSSAVTPKRQEWATPRAKPRKVVAV